MKKRILTVSYIVNNCKEVPFIRIQGKWLKELGFEVSSKILIHENKGELILRLINDKKF